MPTFSNVSDTSATIDPGFDYFDYADEMDDALWSLADSADTVAGDGPDDWHFPASQSWGEWWDGTVLEATLSSWSNSSATLTSFALYAPDGSWLTGDGSGKVGFDAYGEITSVSTFSLRQLGIGNDWAAQFANGSLKLNPETGVVSGKMNSLTLGWYDDDPFTAGEEWLYVTLKGSVSISGDILDASASLSGKVTGVEWGTMVVAPGTTSLTMYADGSIGGLKLDPDAVMDALDEGGFEGLSEGLYTGNDQIGGTGGDDFLDAGAGNDKVSGNDGDDYIDGGDGNDQLGGGFGDDEIYGWNGNDKITDLDGDNVVEGESGNDVLVTGGGSDILVGGIGADKLTGGAGVDVFWFDNLASGGADTVNDFNALDDYLAFDTTVFTSLAGGIGPDNVVFGKTALDTNDFLIFDTQGGKLYYDADGSGGQAAIQIAIVKGSVSGIDSDNFIGV